MVNRHYLVPGDGCVLAILLYDEGDPNAIDDESWKHIWIEVPAEQALEVEFSPQATEYGSNVWGLDKEDSLVNLTVKIWSYSPTTVFADLHTEDERWAMLSGDHFFVVLEPYEEHIRTDFRSEAAFCRPCDETPESWKVPCIVGSENMTDQDSLPTVPESE